MWQVAYRTNRRAGLRGGLTMKNPPKTQARPATELALPIAARSAATDFANKSRHPGDSRPHRDRNEFLAQQPLVATPTKRADETNKWLRPGAERTSATDVADEDVRAHDARLRLAQRWENRRQRLEAQSRGDEFANKMRQ